MANIQFAHTSKITHMTGGERPTLRKQQTITFMDEPPYTKNPATRAKRFLWNILPSK